MAKTWIFCKCSDGFFHLENPLKSQISSEKNNNTDLQPPHPDHFLALEIKAGFNSETFVIYK